MGLAVDRKDRPRGQWCLALSGVAVVDKKYKTRAEFMVYFSLEWQTELNRADLVKKLKNYQNNDEKVVVYKAVTPAP